LTQSQVVRESGSQYNRPKDGTFFSASPLARHCDLARKIADALNQKQRGILLTSPPRDNEALTGSARAKLHSEEVQND